MPAPPLLLRSAVPDNSLYIRIAKKDDKQLCLYF